MNIVDYVKQFPQRRFTKGELVMSEGDISHTLLAISTGYVKVTSLDDNGNQRLLWIAGRYDIVPTEQFFSHHRSLQFFYTALSDGVAYEIPKIDFLKYAKTDLTLMTEIATSMGSHYDDLLLRINSVEQTNVRNKIVASLRYLAERFSADQVVDLYERGLRITHQDLAEMVGSTRETTSLELQRLRTSGCIEYDRTKFVIYLDRCLIS
jgi:CRP/FNR family transcriptional regulator